MFHLHSRTPTGPIKMGVKDHERVWLQCQWHERRTSAQPRRDTGKASPARALPPQLLPLAVLLVIASSLYGVSAQAGQAACVGVVAGRLPAPDAPARQATLYNLGGAAVNGEGVVYMISNYSVYAALQDNSFIRVAGSGCWGFSGDGGPAVQACMMPYRLALDNAGNILVAEYWGGRVRKIWMETGLISTIAGSGSMTFSGDGGLATAAGMAPYGVAVDAGGNVLIVDANRIRKVFAQNGTIITIVGGNSTAPFCGDGGLAIYACLNLPDNVMVRANGDIIIADWGNGRVRAVSPNGQITTVFGAGPLEWCRSNGSALDICSGPVSMTFDASDNMYVADYTNGRIWVVWAANGTAEVLAGSGYLWYCGEGMAATAACFQPVEVAFDHATAELVVADYYVNVLYRLPLATRIIRSVAGVGTALRCAPDGTPATASCVGPSRLAVDADDNLYITDNTNNVVWKVYAANGSMAVVAGVGFPGYTGDGGPATAAAIETPWDVAIDVDGGIVVIEKYVRVRKVWPNGTISTVLSGEVAGIEPYTVAVDRDGNYLVTDVSLTNRVWKLWLCSGCNGTLAPLVGNGSSVYCGDGLPALQACMQPWKVALDSHGNIIIADGANNRVLKVHASNQTVVTLAGNGTFGVEHEGPATATSMWSRYVAVDAGGNVYAADSSHSRVFKIAPDGMLSFVAGTGKWPATVCGTNLTPLETCMSPYGVAVDSRGNLLVADTFNALVFSIPLSSTTGCPPGNACPCGAPEPCADPASYCPGDVWAPIPVTPGYYSVPEQLGALRTGQQLCPRGSYCRNGARVRCPPGHHGKYTQQVKATSCSPCRKHMYAPAGETWNAPACLPCPAGSLASVEGAAFCGWCAPNTAANAAAIECSPCAAGTYSLGGASTCAPLPAGMGVTTWRSFAMLAVTEQAAATSGGATAGSGSTASLADGTVSSLMLWLVPLPIVVLAALPALYMIVTGRLCARDPSWHGGAKRWLRRVDVFGLKHRLPQGAHPTMRNTTLGGAITVIAFGTIVAIAAALVAQYRVNNQLEQPPVFAPVVESYAQLPPKTVEAQPGSGLQVELRTMGPRCGNVRAWAASNLLAGSFNYSSQLNDTTGAARHVFACPACAFSSISTLDVALDGTCRPVLVLASAVGATGVVTRASFTAASECATDLHTGSCAASTSAGVAFVPTLQIAQNAVTNEQFRGFQVAPADAAMVPRNADKDQLLLHIELPLAPWFVSSQVAARQTTAQLLSSIIGLAAILPAFATMFAHLEWYFRQQWSRAKRQSRASRTILHSSYSRAGDGGCASGELGREDGRGHGCSVAGNTSLADCTDASSSARGLKTRHDQSLRVLSVLRGVPVGAVVRRDAALLPSVPAVAGARLGATAAASGSRAAAAGSSGMQLNPLHTVQVGVSLPARAGKRGDEPERLAAPQPQLGTQVENW